MLMLEVLEFANSEWCSPGVIFFKKDGLLCICIDLRKLSSISAFDVNLIRRTDDLLEKTFWPYILIAGLYLEYQLPSTG